ncbi:hypothetical protein GALMADRAFT_213419 [Galerina marginata CBS 339.88]|uniref:Uncharacterized protein n=1 Tax=Galerina marginata (strain CBS 339.88) TaxID=685588 RepID=A0A067T0D6_GALM3|nr:hypothetical protein GALMADRAFT_213419 [Galerina marginata CBS 339.88]
MSSRRAMVIGVVEEGFKLFDARLDLASSFFPSQHFLLTEADAPSYLCPAAATSSSLPSTSLFLLAALAGLTGAAAAQLDADEHKSRTSPRRVQPEPKLRALLSGRYNSSDDGQKPPCIPGGQVQVVRARDGVIWDGRRGVMPLPRTVPEPGMCRWCELNVEVRFHVGGGRGRKKKGEDAPKTIIAMVTEQSKERWLYIGFGSRKAEVPKYKQGQSKLRGLCESAKTRID